jgi:V8-like Glu-specific endopeptidase
MQHVLHKWQVAIVWKLDKSQGSKIGRGSGLLISKDLVLTAAHNFYYSIFGQTKNVDLDKVNMYPGQYG